MLADLKAAFKETWVEKLTALLPSRGQASTDPLATVAPAALPSV